MNARKSWRLVELALLVAASGCGSGLINVSGRLTYTGQPVPSTRVKFVPADNSRPSHGLTDDNGNFTLRFSRTEDGVKLGKHTVYLKYEVSAEEETHQIAPKASKELKAVIARYGDPKTSPLHYEVTAGGQHFDIPLK